MTTGTLTHAFEAAGLGLAPFRLIGMESPRLNRDGQKIVGEIRGVEVLTKCGGTCDFCGTAITNAYKIQSADGKRFHVGSDCVLKVDGKSGDMAREVRRLEKERKRERDAARIAAAMALVDSGKADALLNEPHPAYPERTMLGYVNWMLRNAGTSGKLRAARIVEGVAK